MPHPFGELLRRLRQHSDLTIEGLSEKSGVSARTISDIERGRSIGPQRRTVVALADGLDLVDQQRVAFLGAARPGRRGAAFEGPPVSVRPHRLPDFSGRDAEMDVLASLLSPENSTAAPVLVSGTAGAGKTTVALEALYRAVGERADILFVNLESPDTPPLTPVQVLQALLRQAGTAEEPQTLSEAEAAWRRANAGASRLVLLDNVTDEAQVRPVLTAPHPTRIVMTSRRTLAGLEGCQRIVLGSFARTDSIAFLRSMIPPTQQTVGDLAELAELCADLPLALRIAGNRISSRPAWSVEDFAKRLRTEATRLRHLVAGDLRVESTFTLSYQALTMRSQAVFRSISLIAGSSFRADMVSAIDGTDDEATREILDELTDLALLEPLSADRYRIHDLLRLFAERRLSADQSPDHTSRQRDRLRRWTLETARAMALVTEETDAVAGPDDPTLASARDWLTTETDAWLTALSVASATPTDSRVAVLDTAHALLRFAERWLVYPHWGAVAQIAVSAAESLGDPGAIAEQLQRMAALELARFDGDPDVAEGIASRARALGQAAGAQEPATWALVSLAWSALRKNDRATALARARQAVDEARADGLVEAEVHSRSFAAAALMPDDPEGALHEAQEMRRVLDERGRQLSLRDWQKCVDETTAIFVKALLRLGRYTEAHDVAERMITDSSLYPFEPDLLARAYRHRGFAHLGLGENDAARRDLQCALDLVEEHERPDWWAAEIQDALDALD